MVAAADALVVSAEQWSALESIARPQVLPHRRVRQARALLWAAEGVANGEIARRAATSLPTVRRWRAWFEAEGVESVGRVRPGRGCPVVIDEETVNAVVSDTLHTVPEDGSQAWSTRSLAAKHGVSKDTVARIWRARGLRPWRVDTSSCPRTPRSSRS